MKGKPAGSNRLRILLVLVLVAFVAKILYDIRINSFFFRSSQTVITLDFQSGGDPTRTLFFPPGSKPRLCSVTIRNPGDSPVRAPFLVVNEANPFASLNDLTASCRSRHSDPQAVLVCLSEILSDNLVHRDIRIKGHENQNFPSSVLEALNYYGYSSCGPSSQFLAQLAQSMNLQACLVDFKSHVVAEIEVDGRWILLDSDRRFFYTSDDYSHVLGLEEFRNRKAWQTAPGGHNKHAYAVIDSNIRDLHKSGSRYCGAVETGPFALQEFLLHPGEELHFDRTYRRELIGSEATLTRLFRPSDPFRVNLPYPALSVRIEPLEPTDPIAGKILYGGGKEQKLPAGPGAIDLAGSDKIQSRITGYELKMESAATARIATRMRYANKAFPELTEGINTFRFRQADADEGKWNVRIDLTLKTRRYHRDFQPDPSP